MDRENIKQIQTKVINLLKNGAHKPLRLLSKDNCSEMSRLVGCWILKKRPNAEVYIIKGENVMKIKGRCHDILALKYRRKIQLIDPTIWQFFKNKKTIFIKNTNDLETDCMPFLKKIYKGRWYLSEKLNKNKCKRVKVWKKTIALNTCIYKSQKG